ncbi:cell division protein [Bifidobacterium ramosum]|uniref:Cell division protein n=1 Tax=Bifidobacterium ramosum TaxID=1798158 RepID=A0A6L4X178_9BIFI|nr:cell division protein [Bifidobacterium ramosum]KAB8288727.1 cell division protein [Bifidobacterium ramosum]
MTDDTDGLAEGQTTSTTAAAQPAPTEAAPIITPATAPATPTAPAQTTPAAPETPTAKPPFPMDALPDMREASHADATDFDTESEKSRDEFTTVYDIIDQLEAALDEAKGSIFSPGLVKVDRDEFGGQLDELKKMLPVQLERASALMREAERRLESAQTQANAVVAAAQSRAADMIKDANEQAQFLAGQENVTEIARQKARTILDQAQAKADRLTNGADQYCTQVMEGLQQQLGKLDRDVQAGLNVLYERQRSAGEQLPHLDNNDYPEG